MSSVIIACKLVLVWSGIFETSIIQDDAYYYFTIARNVALGKGATFDGVARTNGFHPLWLLLLVPLFRMAPTSMWIPIRVALSLNVLFDALSGLILFRLLERRVDWRAAWLGALIWLSAPTNAVQAFFGMEGSLVTLLVLAFLKVLLDVPWMRRSPKQHAAAVGFLGGMCGLARTDQILLCACVLLTIVLRQPARWGQRCRWLALVAVTAAIVLTPWFAWNQREFGTFEQVSGRIKRHSAVLWGALPHDWSSPSAAIKTAVTRLFPPVVVVLRSLAVDYEMKARWTPWLLALWLTPGLWLAALGARRLARGAIDWLSVGFAYILAHVVIYGVVLGFYAPWYAAPVLALSAMFVGAGATSGYRSVRGNRLLVTLLPLLVVQIALVLINAQTQPHIRRGAEHRWRAQFDHALKVFPNGLRIGLFDAGAAGYVAGWYPQVTVVNLDGMVNNAALAAIDAGRYPEYLIEHIDLFLQSPRRLRMFLDDEEFERCMRTLDLRKVPMPHAGDDGGVPNSSPPGGQSK